jgi:hypothetical protein
VEIFHHRFEKGNKKANFRFLWATKVGNDLPKKTPLYTPSHEDVWGLFCGQGVGGICSSLDRPRSWSCVIRISFPQMVLWCIGVGWFCYQAGQS